MFSVPNEQAETTAQQRSESNISHERWMERRAMLLR